MPNWRRAHVPGGSFFFTVVTDGRRPLFENDRARMLLGEKLRAAEDRWPFHVNAIVLLPDHLHAIWMLPRGDTSYDVRWAWIKKEFTKAWLVGGGHERPQSVGRTRDGRRGVWQPKYWEHTLEDEDDFERHFDYIHFNPVKHGLVAAPYLWPHSSFARWVEHGVYSERWACGPMPNTLTSGFDFGATTGEP
jgi:putative transposase